MELDVALPQETFESGLHAAVVRREQRGGLGDNVEGEAQVGPAAFLEEALEAVLGGEG